VDIHIGFISALAGAVFLLFVVTISEKPWIITTNEGEWAEIAGVLLSYKNA